MNRYNKILIFILICIISVQCKSVSKSSKNKDLKAKENSDLVFYEKYSKIFGYILEKNEEKAFIEMVDTWLGVPYKYGGCSKEGTDCSCFVSAFYKDFFKINLPRKSEDMYKQTEQIEINNLQWGDLVFFKIKSDKISHVGIYISSKHFIHATTSKGVMINSLDENYYKNYFYKAGRVKNINKSL